MTKVNYICQLLIDKIERAPDFGYDDEGLELSRLLALEGRYWKWNNQNRVEVLEVDNA